MARNPETLKKQIRRFRERKHPLTWREICERLQIFKEDGATPDTGLASLLAYGRKNGQQYSPSEKVILQRLNLPVVCKACSRTMYAKKEKAPIAKSTQQIWWSGLPKHIKDEIIAEAFRKWNGEKLF